MRHQEINRLFGFKKWKGHVRHKTLDERSGAVKQLLLDQDIVDPAALAAGKGNLDEEMGHFVQLPDSAKQEHPGEQAGWKARAARCWEPSYSNYIWAGTFGWMMALVYVLVGGILMLTWVGRDHARLAFAMAKYWLWPFQKYVCARRGMERYLTIAEDRVASINNNYHNSSSGHRINGDGGGGDGGNGSSYTSLRNETDPLVVRSGVATLDEDASIIASNENSSSWQAVLLWLRSLRPSEPITVGYVIWLVLWIVLLAPLHLLVWFFTWETVLLIPMAKVAMRLLKYSYYQPLSLQIERDYPGADRDVIVCCFKAANHYYYKYSVFGMNIILINLLPFVLISLFVGYVIPHITPNEVEAPPAVRTILTLISAVPLTYYIGSAVSSLSAQATPAVGAVLNATFGSIVDLIVYFLAIAKGSLDGLVTAGVTGSLLGMMLLTPGLCMLAGGIKYRQQRFSSAAAGVSIVLLFVSLIGAFIPTIFYNLFGARTLACQECVIGLPNSTEIFYPVMYFKNGRTASFALNDSSAMGKNFTDWSCNFCIWGYTNIDDDPIYRDKARILQYIVAAIMPIAYVVGLLFTLKTHTHIYEIEPDPHDAEEGGQGGHDAPEWNKLTAFIILLSATTLFALIAEELVDSLDGTLTALGISPAFAGLTIIALITNLSEIVNAIRFSLQNDFALALEIGTGCSIQIFLLQMPLLVLFSALYNHGSATDSFTLIFPWLDVAAVTLALFVINYISIDGKANYFTGSALTITYIILIVAFAYAPDWSATVA